jgi:hypothetical protein
MSVTRSAALGDSACRAPGVCCRACVLRRVKRQVRGRGRCLGGHATAQKLSVQTLYHSVSSSASCSCCFVPWANIGPTCQLQQGGHVSKQLLVSHPPPKPMCTMHRKWVAVAHAHDPQGQYSLAALHVRAARRSQERPEQGRVDVLRDNAQHYSRHGQPCSSPLRTNAHSCADRLLLMTFFSSMQHRRVRSGLATTALRRRRLCGDGCA